MGKCVQGCQGLKSVFCRPRVPVSGLNCHSLDYSEATPSTSSSLIRGKGPIWGHNLLCIFKSHSLWGTVTELPSLKDKTCRQDAQPFRTRKELCILWNLFSSLCYYSSSSYLMLTQIQFSWSFKVIVSLKSPIICIRICVDKPNL